MQKQTHDYDNVFKTMKSKHKRLFVAVINDIFGTCYPMEVRVDVLPSEGYLTESETADGRKEIEEQISGLGSEVKFTFWNARVMMMVPWRSGSRNMPLLSRGSLPYGISVMRPFPCRGFR